MMARLPPLLRVAFAPLAWGHAGLRGLAKCRINKKAKSFKSTKGEKVFSCQAFA